MTDSIVFAQPSLSHITIHTHTKVTYRRQIELLAPLRLYRVQGSAGVADSDGTLRVRTRTRLARIVFLVMCVTQLSRDMCICV